MALHVGPRRGEGGRRALVRDQRAALGSARSAAARGWTRFHLADALDELEPQAQSDLLERVVKAAAPNARMVSWRLVRPYARHPSLLHRITRDEAASASAWAREAVPAWSGVDVENVRGDR